jgi:glycosyltransferase involved in cell wall biosynthesis
VATAAGGLAHLVDDLGAVRIPPGEPDALAAAVTGLLADPGRRAAMGAHNRARVERELTWERVVERLERIYGEALPG